MTESIAIGIFLFWLGAIFGSFLNVCIARLPLEQSVVTPRSHCMACKKPIPWFYNIPIFSYLVLRGKCKFCGVSFSARYVFVELITAFTFVFFYKVFGLTPLFCAYVTMACGFIVATFVDFGHRIIPDEISVGGTYAGLLFSLFIPSMHMATQPEIMAGRIIMWSLVLILAVGFTWEIFIAKRPMEKGDGAFFAFIGFFLACELVLNGLISADYAWSFMPHLAALHAAIIGMFVSGGMIYALGVLGDIIFRKESMGGGDVKLMAMIGAFLGWKLAILAFFIAPIFGAVFGIVEKIRTGDTTIAYGPFLVLGALISLFYNKPIVAWIISGYGLY